MKIRINKRNYVSTSKRFGMDRICLWSSVPGYSHSELSAMMDVTEAKRLVMALNRFIETQTNRG